jgi:hypothetical protein
MRIEPFIFIVPTVEEICGSQRYQNTGPIDSWITQLLSQSSTNEKMMNDE